MIKRTIVLAFVLALAGSVSAQTTASQLNACLANYKASSPPDAAGFNTCTKIAMGLVETPVKPSPVVTEEIRDIHKGAETPTRGVAQENEYPKVEVFTGYSYTDGLAQGVNQPLPLGFASDFTYNIKPMLGIEGDLDYGNKPYYGLASIWSYDYMVGPRLSFRGKGNGSDFYVHGLVGGTTVGVGAFGVAASTSALSFGGGAGLNIRVANHLTIRAFEVDYLNGRFNNLIGSSVNIIKVKTGVVFTF